MFKVSFDSRKALEVILYITENAPIKDIYHILKIQFFADRNHLEQYGRFITGDNYIAMKNGPVASNAYNFIKLARDSNQCFIDSDFAELIQSSLQVGGGNEGHSVKALRKADIEYLSQSDINCLNKSVEENGKLSFSDLNNKSHDDLWQCTDENNEILLESFVKYSSNPDELRTYLNE
ncbi:Panacea domain-containing protein [Pasteurella skyensis]|uniref:Panacea domain-containing protein n=1 Tax=Phocoenobacter skyensis TaxID=97481 RepID=A0AAJ6N8E0_9PAST|nr:Panacea domain-containing protein [Pasteurella skyensis]MDP8161955.1 Panacea domain-containing protein [Pasteurella skyensis]MDP8170268.1 Panacea domain-containing protein [Pasteurella skyensis]MDP8172111.1 Panacea domain-containing protein [Pasteurella skyensis]MDP8176541.1 Panacea domain-containing protein [Pasteurella skyensis]MDP8178429.1 Panacea domain-containing protein [Pasteurella skyensis]